MSVFETYCSNNVGLRCFFVCAKTCSANQVELGLNSWVEIVVVSLSTWGVVTSFGYYAYKIERFGLCFFVNDISIC